MSLLTVTSRIQVSAGPGLLALTSHSLHFERDKEKNSPRVCIPHMSHRARSPVSRLFTRLVTNAFASHKFGFILLPCENDVLCRVGPDYSALLNGSHLCDPIKITVLLSFVHICTKFANTRFYDV